MADCETVQKQSDLKDRRMILRWPFLKALLPAIAGALLATAAFADPHNAVKNTIIREENPKGLKSALVVPYAFSTDSMGLTAGVGGMLKGYGQEQLLLGTTAFGSSDEAVDLFLGMWDYRPPWTRRFFFSAQGMAAHYPKNRAYAAPYYRAGATRRGSNDLDKDDYAETAATTTGPISGWSMSCPSVRPAMTRCSTTD